MSCKLVRLIILAYVFTFFPFEIHAESLLVLSDAQEKYPLGKYISVLEDASGKLTIDDISQSEYHDQYRTFNEDTPNLGFSTSVFWVRLHLKNESSLNVWLLDQRFANTHYLDLYVASEDGKTYKITESGNLRPYSNRKIPHRRIIFKLPLESGQQRTLYLRFQSHAAISLSLQLWSESALANADRTESFWMGMYYGIFAMILIISLILYLSFHRTSYLFLALFVTSTGAMYLFYDGYAQMIFSAGHAKTSSHFIPMLLSVAMVTLLYFVRTILSTTIENLYIHRMHIALVIVWAVLFFMGPIGGYHIIIRIIIPLILFTLLYLLVVSALSWNRQHSTSRFILIGLISFFLGFLGLALALFGFVESRFILVQGIRISLVILLVFMSLAIVDHIQWLLNIRKQTGKALTASEQKFRAIFDQTFQLTGVLSPKGKILELNKAALAFGDVSESDVLGKYFWDAPWWAHVPAQQEKLHAAVKQAADDEHVRFEMKLPGTNGKERWMDFSLKPYKDKTGKITMLIPEGWDITERKHIEQAINDIATGVSAQSGKSFFQQLVFQLAKVFNADYVLIALVDKNNTDTVQTLAVCTFGEIVDNFSYSLAGSPCMNVVGKQPCTYADNVQALFPRDQLLVEMDAKSYIGTPLHDSKGIPTGLIIVIDRKPMENTEYVNKVLQIFAARAGAEMERSLADTKLQNAKQKLALHVQQTPLAVIEWNIKFEVIDWNPAAEHIFGYSRNEAVGKHAADLIIPPSAKPHVNDIWQALLANRGGMRSTNENVTRDGRTIMCEWYNTPLVTEVGEVIGVASLVVDNTEKVHAQQELGIYHHQLENLVARRTADLETVNKELESFSYSVSHDLRAPLRAIDGFSLAVLEDHAEKLDSEGRGYLQRVRKAAQRMSVLIDDILQLSRVTRYKIRSNIVNLSDLALESLARLEENNPNRKTKIIIHPDIKAEGDNHLLGIVLDNLLDNAWKYTNKTENPEIEFGISEKDGETIFFVKDNGAGFNMKHADKLFGAFQRLHRTDEFPGTGIGLATVQRIIQRHGGHIWAEAEASKGATFFFTLAQAQPSENDVAMGATLP